MISIKTIFQGALGALSFGMYHHYVTNKMMEEHNKQQDLKMKEFKDKLNKVG